MLLWLAKGPCLLGNRLYSASTNDEGSLSAFLPWLDVLQLLNSASLYSMERWIEQMFIYSSSCVDSVYIAVILIHVAISYTSVTGLLHIIPLRSEC